MISEHLHQWLIYATQDDSPDATNWQKVVAIAKSVFRDGMLAEEFTWKTFVLITKGKRDFRGVLLAKFLWKVVAILLKRRLMSDIMFHDVLHGFRAGRGTGTATLEAKLLQQLTYMKEAVLFNVLLGLQKEHDALDWYIKLEILVDYGVSPRMIRLLQTYWERLTMVARAGGYFGRPFKGHQCVTHGDPLSPTIFNVVADAVIRHWLMLVTPTDAGTGVLVLTIIELAAYLYADDGLIALTQPEKPQREFDVLTGFFDRVGLRKNTEKTASMVYQTCHAPGVISSEAYKRHTTGISPTFWERQRRKVE